MTGSLSEALDINEKSSCAQGYGGHYLSLRTENNCPERRMVETAGIEPASEKEALTASTCVDYV